MSTKIYASQEWVEEKLATIVDPTLAVEGAAADAKAVGDALVTKVSFTEAQELTEEQKQQARANIDAIANSDIPIKTVELTEIPNKFRVWEYDTGIYYIIPSSTMFTITVKTGTGDDTKEGGMMISGITKLPIFVNKYSNDSVDRWIYWYPSRSGFTSQQLEYSKTDLTWTVNTVEKLPALSGSPDIAGQTIRVNNDGKGYVLSNNVWSVNGQTDDVTITAEDIGAATQEYVFTLVGNTAVSEQIENAIADAGFVVSPFVATVGQILSVKAVDENGKPTEWEAVDVSNIEGSNGIGIKSIRIEEVM